MKSSRNEPEFVYSVEEVAAKSKILAAFVAERELLNANVDAADNALLKRFYNIDHNTYLNGALGAAQKELQGLAVSAALRCDDCINYHILQAYRLGCSRAELEETLNVSLVVGGSIVIPHLRRAYAVLTELYGS